MKKKQVHKYPDGNPGSTKNTAKVKDMYGKIIVNKNAEIRYLQHQIKAMMVRMQKVLSCYHGANSKAHFVSGRDAKYCVCCGQTIPNEYSKKE